MPAPTNRLKASILAGEMQRGIWLGLTSPAVAEMAGAAGFDWCLIDGEHGPNDLPLIETQLRALHGLPASAIVRVPQGDDWILKQVLDIGAQSILVPMVETAHQAANTRQKGIGGSAMHWPAPVVTMRLQTMLRQLIIRSVLFYR